MSEALLAGAARVACAPAAALFAFGLGLLAGVVSLRAGDQRARGAPLAVVAALAAGWLAGGMWAAQRGVPAALAWIALACVPLVGAALALNAAVPARFAVTSAVLGGALHGAVGGVGGELVAASGSALVAAAFATVGAAAALLVRGPRTRIVARVAGSWIAAIGLLLVAWQARPALVPIDPGCASCAIAKLSNGWCDACRTGWVASFEVESKMLFEALDAHGHDLDRDVMECATCKRLIDEGGFCEACRFGWVGGQAYMSRLTYHLAKGTPRDARDVGCASCAELFGGTGWCRASGGGWAGNVWFLDSDDHADALRELDRLHAATAASMRCENCALAILVDGQCPYCRVRYVLGRPAAADGG